MKRLALVATCSFALLAHPLTMAAAPAFSGGGLTFHVHEYTTETELIFIDPMSLESRKSKAQQEHSVEMKGLIRIDDKQLDVVGFTEDLKAARATGAGEASVLKPVKRSNQSQWDEDYSAMEIDGAMVEVDDVTLSANPYTLAEMVVLGQAVIARQRVEKTIDAIVEEDKKVVLGGIAVRLSSMKISTSRDVELELEYDRKVGNGSPLLEAIYAIDAQDNLLGGGRWDKAEGIFGSRIKFKSKFAIPARTRIDRLKLVFLTEYEVKPYAFIVKDIFQK